LVQLAATNSAKNSSTLQGSARDEVKLPQPDQKEPCEKKDVNFYKQMLISRLKSKTTNVAKFNQAPTVNQPLKPVFSLTEPAKTIAKGPLNFH